jgi:hypothetical protein
MVTKETRAMAKTEHLQLLEKGIAAWNQWRRKNRGLHPDLREANLSEADLRGVYLNSADLRGACLQGANLSGAYLNSADLQGTDLSGANVSQAILHQANLTGAVLVGADFERADLTGCFVYGISAWNVRLKGTTQLNLVITPEHEPVITVDNLEVAQFIYLLLHHEKIREVIDTITSKAVLILGRFTLERKAVLDAIRDELRRRNYLPVVFDFDKPASKDLSGTVATLANMARFIIADLTDPRSIPQELSMVVPGTVVPVQPILLEGQQEYAMFLDLKRRYHWVLEPHQYASPTLLIAHLEEQVIGPAEAKAQELRLGAFRV